MKKIKNDKILIKMSQIGASQVFSKVDFFLQEMPSGANKFLKFETLVLLMKVL